MDSTCNKSYNRTGFRCSIRESRNTYTYRNTYTHIHVKGGEQKISLFADDILIQLSSPEQSLTHLFYTTLFRSHLFSLLDQYGSFSGSLKLNVSKTHNLFQSLPLEISNQQFQEWDKLISRYI